MADEIEVANLVTKLSLDDTGVERSMAALNRQMKSAQTEFQAVSSKLAGVGTAEEQLRAKTDSLNKQMEIQAQKILQVKKRHDESVSAKGADAQATQKLEANLNKLVAQYNKMHNELKTTETQITKQVSAWNKLSTAVNEAAKKMETAGRTMTNVGQGLTLALTVPIAAVGGVATKASVEFETAFAGVEKTVDGTKAELLEFKKEIRNMATDIPAAATAIAGVAEAAGQLGIKNSALMGFTRTMTDLGVATNMGASEAATSLARLANITQMPQQNFDRLGATIVDLGNNFATTESEITAMGLRLAGAGHQVNMTEAQILGLAAGLSSVGIEAEAGGSSVSKVMVDIASAVATGGKDLKKFADVAGMSSGAFKKSFETDASGAVITFIEGLKKLSDSGANVFGVLENLGLSEIRVRDALLRAAGAGDLFRNAIDIGSKAWEENTALTTEAGKRYETTASQMQVLKNRMTDAAITLGDALVPLIMALFEALEPIIQGLAKVAEAFSSLGKSTQVTIAAVAGLLAIAGPLLIIAGQLTIAFSALLPVIMKMGTFLATWMLNPVVLGLTALAAIAAVVAVNIYGAKKATEELTQAQEALLAVQEKGITRSEVASAQEKIDKLKELTETYKKLIETASTSDQAQMGNNLSALYSTADELDIKLEDLEETARTFGIELEYVSDSGKLTAKSLKELKDATAIYAKAIKDANRETTSELNEMAKKIAVRNREVASTESLIKTYQSAKKGSKEYTAAQSELAQMFPQLTTATGINVEAIKGLLIVKQREIELEWASIQAKAAEAVQEKNTAIVKQQAAIAVAEAIMKIAGSSGLAENALARMNGELARLRGEAANLQSLLDIKPGDYKIAPITVPKVPTAEPKKDKTPAAAKADAYENKALDEAYKQMEHKKKMDQLTLENELKTLETIQSKYVKTAEERMEIEEKIYDVKKALGDASLEKALKDYDRSKEAGKLTEVEEVARLQRIKKLYANSAEERADMDDRIYEAQKRIVEADKQLRIDATKYTSQQLQAAYEDRVAREHLTDEASMKLKDKLYNEQIYLNKNYLQKVLADDRYTAVEKRNIEKEITEEIRMQTNDRLQLQKDYTESNKKIQIDSINDMSKGIQDALKAKYQAEKTAAEDNIKDAISANNDWKEAQLASIKTVYDAKISAAQKAADAEIEQLNRTLNAQIDAIQAELDALDKAEKQKSRAEMDADDAKKIGQLTSKIEYEHDDFNKAALQKELNKVLAEQEKRHQAEQLTDKKEALKNEQQAVKDKLKEQTDAIKEQLVQKKEIMAAEYLAQQENINAIYTATKASLDQQLLDTQAHYTKLLEAKSLQAEAEKMIMQNQQEEILKLLEKFGEGYQAAGQTLGEKMLAGFKPKIDQISGMIASVIAQIDAARSAALETMALASQVASAPTSKSGGSSSTSKGTTVSVTNNFNNPVTSPSSISAATNKAAQQLAFKV